MAKHTVQAPRTLTDLPCIDDDHDYAAARDELENLRVRLPDAEAAAVAADAAVAQLEEQLAAGHLGADAAVSALDEAEDGARRAQRAVRVIRGSVIGAERRLHVTKAEAIARIAPAYRQLDAELFARAQLAARQLEAAREERDALLTAFRAAARLRAHGFDGFEEARRALDATETLPRLKGDVHNWTDRVRRICGYDIPEWPGAVHHADKMARRRAEAVLAHAATVARVNRPPEVFKGPAGGPVRQLTKWKMGTHGETIPLE